MSSTDNTVLEKPRHRSPWWKKVLKTVLIAAVAILALLILATGATVWILTPERLTPIVNRVANENLRATVNAGRVELTFWSTFPRLHVDVDSLTIVSHSLDSVGADTRRRLPAGADSLLSLGRMSAGVDVMALLIGDIDLYDVGLRRPRLNIVMVDSTTNNFSIVEPTAEIEEKVEPAAITIPALSINRFTIADGFPISFISLADSIDAHINIEAGELKGDDAPIYTIAINGTGGGGMDDIRLKPTPVLIDGNIGWKPKEPGAVRLDDFKVAAGGVTLKIDADLELLDSLTVNSLNVSGHDIAIADIVSLIPEPYAKSLSGLSTNLKASFNARLLAPYIPASGKTPPVDIDLTIPRGQLRLDRLNLAGLELDMKAHVEPNNLNRSILTLKKLRATGRAIDFTLSGTVRTPITDPAVDGKFNGSVDFGLLPEALTAKLPAKVEGRLEGNATFNLRQSYLSQRGFHRIKMDGELNLSNFRATMNDGSGMLYTRHTRMKLGSHNSIEVNGQRVDSLLTASLTIDTIVGAIPGLGLSASGVEMGFGSRNIATSADTTQINPLGASIRLRHLGMRSDSDSIRLLLKDAFVKATLQRYNSQARSPLLRLNMEMGRARMADLYNRVSLTDATASLELHPKNRPAMSRRFQTAYDSIAALHAGLSADSLMTLTRATMRRTARLRDAAAASDGREKIDFQLDNSLRSWLRLWQAEGTLKARRARLFTPYFPVRNTISGLDMSFSTDSVSLRNTRYKMGQSDFLINGTISNISRALTSRRGSPIKVELDVKSDTLNINDITRALMMGGAFADRLADGEARMADADADDEVLDAAIDNQIDDDERGAVLIPTNVAADISISAGTMTYADILFKRFVGRLEAANGAVRLDRLSAATTMGSFGMTALYSAPTRDDIRFAGGMVIRKLDLRQFLDMIPAIDTILPMLNSMEGIITAECAMTTELDSLMDIKFNTLDMAMKLSGDSLVLLDNETFRTISKWLMFKNKQRNMIDSMSVEMLVRNSTLQIYPFMVTLDRYRMGVSGNNDADLNLDYHVSVFKSPIPFKFGINIKGTPENMKIRLGGAKLKENEIATSRHLTDTVRINLVNEIQTMFRNGLAGAGNVRLQTGGLGSQGTQLPTDTISAADSTFFIRQGVIPKPEGWIDPDTIAARAARQSEPAKKKHRFW